MRSRRIQCVFNSSPLGSFDSVMWNIKSPYLLNSIPFVLLFYIVLLSDVYGERPVICKTGVQAGEPAFALKGGILHSTHDHIMHLSQFRLCAQKKS